MIRPLMVFVAVAPVIAPDKLRVVTDETAPAFTMIPLIVLDAVGAVIGCNVLNAPVELKND